MENLIPWKITLPQALKERVFAVAEKLSIPAASALRIALTEFVVRHEQQSK